MGKDAPKQPDPAKTAAAQEMYGEKAIDYSAKKNAIDLTSPWGSTTYTKDAQGNPTGQVLTLSPAEQSYYDSISGVRDDLAKNLPTGPFVAPDSSSGDAVQKALYDRQMALITPSLDQADKESNVNLGDRGIPVGSEIWNDENNRLATNRTNAETAAAQQAVLAGGQEQDRQLQDALTLYNEPYQALGQVTGATPTQPPQFASQPAYSLAPPDYAGQVNSNYQSAVQQYNQQQQSIWGGLFGLGSALLSDRRTKKDIRRVGETDAGVPIYTYKYKGGEGPTHMGVMADEVAEFFPDAVSPIAGDIKGVDYGAVA